MWRVGMKAVCVSDAPNRPGVAWRGDAPRVGEVYTITAIFTNHRGRVAFLLAEIERSAAARAKFGVAGYGAYRFRPVVEREYDISIFTAMLNPAKKAAETVGFLAFMGMIGWGTMLADFMGGQ